MDAAAIFRQGLGVIPRQPQVHHFHRPPIPHHYAPIPHQFRDADADGDGSSHRIAHTLTACCRCRQRKTRCDPNLPRCLPCERANATCEYFDTTKNKKINRNYVVKLQEKVRQLETELAHFTEEDSEYPQNHEDMVRPGGMVRLNATDGTPRYLGPSSGIAMTRLLMEEAKRYTESNRISELIPAVRARREEREAERMNRMQSIVATGGSVSVSALGEDIPMYSENALEELPSLDAALKLVETYMQQAQILTPVLHEKRFEEDFRAVYGGDKDPYKNFVVWMVLAIGLQKQDRYWAGLADGCYLAAMQFLEAIVRPKDLKTLQCLLLIGQYSLLTPTRTASYFIIGLATRIHQQLRLGEEKTIALGDNTNPEELDMRRRLGWIVTTMEFGLAQVMGRPSGFGKEDDLMNVEFFATVNDELITQDGIQQGPPSDKKLVAIHFCKMRLLQAEIRRMLYERKRPELNHESRPWFKQMEQKMDEWLRISPEQPDWCKPWFTGRYHSMMITLYRPSPQIPKPTSRAALQCYESSVFVIRLSQQQMAGNHVDITWNFLLNLYMSLNALLWTLSYPEVRKQYPREEVEQHIQMAIYAIERCSVRWPESTHAIELYQVFATACLQSYDLKEGASNSNFGTPPLTTETSSPSTSENSLATSGTGPGSQQAPIFDASFGYAFDSAAAYNYGNFDHNTQHPTFRSNSIWKLPATDGYGRRASSFPPDFQQPKQEQWSEPKEESTPPATATPHVSSTSPPMITPYTDQTPPMTARMVNAIPTPPESFAVLPSVSPVNPHLSPTPSPGLTIPQTSPVMQASPAPIPSLKYEPQPDFGSPTMNNQDQELSIPLPQAAGFATPQQHPSVQQRPLPQPSTETDWFRPPPPLVSSYTAFSGTVNGGYWHEASGGTGGHRGLGVTSSGAPYGGLGANNGLGSYTMGGRDVSTAPLGGPMVTSAGPDFALYAGMDGIGLPGQFGYPIERHASLSHDQQRELLGVLETEGIGEMNSYLSMNMGMQANGAGHEGINWG